MSHVMGTDPDDVFQCGIAVAPVTNKNYYGESRYATVHNRPLPVSTDTPKANKFI